MVQGICEGKTGTDVAIVVRWKLRTLMNWVRRCKAEGFSDQPGRGAQPFLSTEDRDACRDAVVELQEKRMGGRIGVRDILDLMRTRYGIDPSLKAVYDTLRRGEFVWITGRSLLRQM